MSSQEVGNYSSALSHFGLRGRKGQRESLDETITCQSARESVSPDFALLSPSLFIPPPASSSSSVRDLFITRGQRLQRGLQPVHL